MTSLDERRQMERDIANQDDNISYRAARNLIEEFGDLRTIEEQPRSAVLEVSGVGPRTAEKLGVWNDEGTPVGEMTRNACPICHETYEDARHVQQDKPCTFGSVNVCVSVPSDARGSVVLYEH